MFRIRFWGVRGSIPSPGPGTVHFGGNTSCVEMRCGSEILIFDCGTGARLLGDELSREGPLKAHIFFSHVHWDHIQGFPFFRPGFQPGNEFMLCGSKSAPLNIEETLAGQMNYPNFPVRLSQMGATMHYNDLEAGERVEVNGVTIVPEPLSHPNGSFGYRVEHEGKVAVYATDNELGGESSESFQRLARNADVLIHDAQYTEDEYWGRNGLMAKKGWGHSTWNAAAHAAAAAGVKKLVLYHHDHSHDDDFMRDIEQQCRAVFPNSLAAYEGLVLDL